VEHRYPIFGATEIRVYLPRGEREDGQWRCAVSNFRIHADMARLQYSLVIWEWIPAHATLKDRRRVRVFSHRTKIEHPIVLSMARIQKPLRVFAFISVETFYTGRRVTHNNHPIRDVYEIFSVGPSEIPPTLRVEKCFWGRCELACGSPSSRSSFSSLNLALSPDTSRLTKSVMVTRRGKW